MTILDTIEIPDAEPEREENRRRPWTYEEAISLALLWQRETGAPPTKEDWDPAKRKHRLRHMYARCKHLEEQTDRYLGGGYPSAAAVVGLFGSWNAFVAACGWEPRDRGRPRIQAAPGPPPTPTSDQVRLGAGSHVDERRRRALADREAGRATGPAVLADRLRAVVMAQKHGDRGWLAGELEALAASALAWADRLIAGEEDPDTEDAAA